MNDRVEQFAVTLVVVLFLVLAFFMTHKSGRDEAMRQIRQDAQAHGVGHYILVDGDKVWRWGNDTD